MRFGALPVGQRRRPDDRSGVDRTDRSQPSQPLEKALFDGIRRLLALSRPTSASECRGPRAVFGAPHPGGATIVGARDRRGQNTG
jgi:hypothetical protein